MNWPPQPDLTEQAFQESLQHTAERINRLGMVEPVVFLLEAHRPLSSLAHNATIMLQPVLSCLFGASAGAVLERLFESQARIDEFLTLLEKARSA